MADRMNNGSSKGILESIGPRIGSRVTWIAVSLGVIAVIAAGIEAVLHGRPELVQVHKALLVASIAGVVVLPVSYPIRAILPPVTVFLFGITELVFLGIDSLAVMFLIGAATLSGILVGRRAAAMTFGLGALALSASAALYTLQILPIISEVQKSSLVLLHWMPPLVAFLLLSIGSLTLMSFLRLRLRNIEEARRKQTEDHEDEQRLSDVLIDNLPGLFYLYDENNRLVRWNKYHEIASGYGAEELRGMHVTEFYPVDQRDAVKDRIAANRSSNSVEDIEQSVQRKDGQAVPFFFRSAPITVSGKQYFLGVGVDISNRIEMEKERTRLATAISQITEQVMIVDEDGKIVYVNRAFEKVTGFEAEEVVGQPAETFCGDSSKEIIKTAMEGAAWTGKIIGRRKDGSDLRLHTSVAPLRDQNGRIMNYVSVSRDITEEARREALAKQSQKLEAIGLLSAGIAHDFNNILGAVLGYAELGVKGSKQDSEENDYFGEIAAASVRARELVRQILTFSRQSQRSVKPVLPHTAIEETLRLLQAGVASAVQIDTQIDSDVGIVMAGETELHQLILNLCMNACQAVDDAGQIEIRLESAVAGRMLRAFYPELEEGERLVVLRIKDNGCGMEQSVIDRVFEPYFTTKSAGEGTGLGLAVVYGIVKDLGGQISIDSKPGIGTVVTVILPVETGKARGEDPPKQSIPPGRGERILLVEDEKHIRVTGKRILEDLGYEVSLAENAKNALGYIWSDPGSFDLVITDHLMPEMTGLELAQDLGSIAPALPIILISGHLDRNLAEKARNSGVSSFLSKPIRQVEMAAAIHSILWVGR
jgi:two-component system, cell cycle sensor histidine kinase and response regulator CckA